MKLKKVQIQEFRSIENMEIYFGGNGHKILVGLNESGKSNILDALNLLSKNATLDQKDKKQPYSKNTRVEFYFDLEDQEIEKCKKEFVGNFLSGPQAQLTENHTVESFFEKYSEYISYRVAYNKDCCWRCRELDKDLQIHGNWHIAEHEGQNIPEGSYINNEVFNDGQLKELETLGNLSAIQIQDVHNFLCQKVKETVEPEDYSFPVEYWKYDGQEHGLPSNIAKETFSQNPDSCIPLKNMFVVV